MANQATKGDLEELKWANKARLRWLLAGIKDALSAHPATLLALFPLLEVEQEGKQLVTQSSSPVAQGPTNNVAVLSLVL